MRPSLIGALVPHTPRDPFFSDVRLLMHFDDAALGARTAVDSSRFHHLGGAWHNTNDPGNTPPASGLYAPGLVGPDSAVFQAYGATMNNIFASGAVIGMPASADYALPGDFTIEFTIQPNGVWRSAGSTFKMLGSAQDTTGDIAGDWSFSQSNTGALLFGINPGVTVGTLSGNWGGTGVTSQIAAVRSGDNVLLFVNGVFQATAAGALGITLTAAHDIGIGGASDWAITNSQGSGKYDEVRITAAARYTAAGYAPATKPFPNR
jgi:hypothetical protein